MTAAWVGCTSTPIAETTPDPNGCVDRLRIYEVERGPAGVTLAIENRCHVPLTVDVSFDPLVNLDPDRGVPIRVSVEPGASKSFVDLEPLDARAGWRYGTRTRFIVGRDSIEHDESVRYAFPFGGSEPRACAQGIDGSGSHVDSFAFDFLMPIGTPILAARGGIVFRVFDGFDEGQYDREFLERANEVLVFHDDSTIATYSHLRRGIPVRAGDVIFAGQLLGFSGNSGYSATPHLHFQVSIPRFSGFRTIPIRFAGDIVPVPGESYPPSSGSVRALESMPPQSEAR
jgi:hypothetical protein